MDAIDILETQAINAAVSQNWGTAIQLNKEILNKDRTNLGAYLRLGFAYLQMEKIKESKSYYQKALKVQAKNPVAIENIERIKILESKKGGKSLIKIKATLDPNMFLEVPGKTKSVVVVNLGQKNHLAELDIGEEVVLKLKKRRLEVRTKTNSYIGNLPDDVSKRLIYFIKAKSMYKAYTKEASLNRVVLFIQEIKKGKKVASFTSFPTIMKPTVHAHSNDSDESGTDEETEDLQGYNIEDLTAELDTEKEDILQTIQPEEEEESEE